MLAVGFDGREVAAFGRDAMGRETARCAGALTTLSKYDPQGRLVRQTGRSRGAGQPVIARSYRWDEADRLVETHDLARGMRRYQYDACERLVGVAGDAPESFVFDPAGNILGSDADGGGGAAIGDRLLISGDRKFEYDGCGNRIREVRGAGGTVERLYRYRADNQLAELEERSRRGRRLTSFAYDALGRRTEKRSTVWGPVAANDAPAPAAITTRTDFVWSGNVLLAEASTADDTLPADPLAVVYLHEPGSFRPLAQTRRTNTATVGTIYHYQLDHLGTPQEVTNDDGRIVWQSRLKAWGAVAQTLVAELVQPIRFQGQYQDVETGLFYNRFRYYAPEEGRYLQLDPIRLSGGVNLSSYPSAPTHQIDPLGLCPISSPKADFYVNSSGQALPSTGYRYMRYLNDDCSINKYLAQTISSKSAPGSYIGFDNFSTGSEARDALQIRGPEFTNSWSDARLKGTFDTLQLFDSSSGAINAQVPLENGGAGPELEPITRAYPEYGTGNARQLVTPQILNFDRIDILPEN